MRTKTTLFLLVLVVGLGAFVYFFDPNWNVTPGAGRGPNVLGPDAVDLDYLRIALNDQPTPIALGRQPTGWEVVEPVHWAANIFAVNRLLSQLQLLQRETSFPVNSLGQDKQSLSDYGLDPPEGIVTYGRRGERQSLLIGGTTDVGNRLYVRPERGDRVFVVGNALLETLRLPLEQFRNDAVFGIRLFEVRAWNVQLGEAGNLRVWLSRDGDKWRLDAPVQARADKAAVDTLLNRILALKVQSFVRDGPPDPSVLGLTSPALRITIEGAGGRRESLLLGSPVPGADQPRFYAMREDTPGTFLEVQVDFTDELRNAQVGLRDRRLVEFDAKQLQSLRLVPAGRPEITLQKLENGLWQVVSRSEERGLLTLPGDQEIIDALIRELAELRAAPGRGFVSDAPSPQDLEDYGLTRLPAWRIVISERTAGAAGAVRDQTLVLGDSARDRDAPHLEYARMEETSFVYLVDRALNDDLSPEPHHYRNRQLQQLPQGARLTSLTLTHLPDNEPRLAVALSSPEQTWEQALANESPERRAAVLALIEQLRNLRAQRIVAPKFTPTVPAEPETRPWTWRLDALITLEGGGNQQTTPFTLQLDEFAGGTELLAGSSSLDVVFLAERAFIDALAPLVFQRPELQSSDAAPPAPAPLSRAEPAAALPAPATATTTPLAAPPDSIPATAPAGDVPAVVPPTHNPEPAPAPAPEV